MKTTMLTLLALVLLAGSVQAQENPFAPRRAFSLGLAVQGAVIGTDEENAEPDDYRIEENGSGLLFSAGYTVSDVVALVLAIGGAVHNTTESEDASHGTVTFEVHYQFRPGMRTRPFIFGGLGGTAINASPADFDVELSGGMATFGGGVLYSFSKHFRLDAHGRLDLINWTNVEVSRKLDGGETIAVSDPVQENGSAARFMAGITWVL